MYINDLITLQKEGLSTMPKKVKNIPYLSLFLSNLALCKTNGFNWLAIIALVLSGIVLIWNIWDTFIDNSK
jgi:hypothetical protein